MNNAEQYHVNRVARLPCCVCRRHPGWGHFSSAEILSREGHIHHVAEGSGKRSWFAITKLCAEHHEGATGIHGMGSKAFIALYRPPGDSEYGLLVWTNEDLAEQALARGESV